MSKPSLLPCGCDDGTCEQCCRIRDMDEQWQKVMVYSPSMGWISTRTAMDLRRLLKPSKTTAEEHTDEK